jgi:hypothetical protein
VRGEEMLSRVTPAGVPGGAGTLPEGAQTWPGVRGVIWSKEGRAPELLRRPPSMLARPLMLLRPLFRLLRADMPNAGLSPERRSLAKEWSS